MWLSYWLRNKDIAIALLMYHLAHACAGASTNKRAQEQVEGGQGFQDANIGMDGGTAVERGSCEQQQQQEQTQTQEAQAQVRGVRYKTRCK